MGAVPDDPGGAGDLGLGCARPEFQGSGVDAEQGEPVRQYVVHLPGDGLAGQPLRLFGAEVGLRLGAVGAFTQHHDEPTPGTYEHAPDDHQQDQHRAVERRADPGHGRIGAQCGLHSPGRHRRCPQYQDRPERAVHGQAEQRHQHGARGERRERADRHEHRGEPHGPAPAHPQRAAGERADHLVGGAVDVGVARLVLDGVQGQHTDAQRDQEGRDVHDPVAQGAVRPLPVLGRLVAREGRGQQPAVLRTRHANKVTQGPRPVRCSAGQPGPKSRSPGLSETSDFRRHRAGPAGRSSARPGRTGPIRRSSRRVHRWAPACRRPAPSSGHSPGPRWSATGGSPGRCPPAWPGTGPRRRRRRSSCPGG